MRNHAGIQPLNLKMEGAHKQMFARHKESLEGMKKSL
jgi:hypothetical protein